MYTVLRSVRILFDIIEILIIIRIFMSIFRVSMDNVVGKAVLELTEPIMSPARALLDKLGLGRGFIDFSPWVAILFLRLAYTLLINIAG
ncbi:YggT family protein [Gudongella oleilytica]|uniref:YggT family protein n=1 Tax=Gudongella oleilytica TaxID=1582259 RepID=UPI0013E8B502|nr:YggT family protein [Gudongella oleilytica]MDY0256943.1 YggT family protein [Gudongella oleilytica]